MQQPLIFSVFLLIFLNTGLTISFSDENVETWKIGFNSNCKRGTFCQQFVNYERGSLLANKRSCVLRFQAEEVVTPLHFTRDSLLFAAKLFIIFIFFFIIIGILIYKRILNLLRPMTHLTDDEDYSIFSIQLSIFIR